MTKQTKKSEPIKKRTGENAYVGKYEHLFNKRWTDDEIKAVADELLQWMEEKVENIWYKDFCVEKRIGKQRISEFAKQNEYFAWIIDLCQDIQESRMFKLGTSKKTNPAMFILGLKSNHGWKDYTEVKIQDMPEIHIGIIPNRTTEDKE